MMKDKIKNYRNLQEFQKKCLICHNNVAHLSNECSKIHYIPNKDFLIKRLNYSKPQIRKESFKKRKKFRFQTLKNLNITQFFSSKFMKNQEESKNEFSDSEEDDTPPNRNEIEKNQEFFTSEEREIKNSNLLGVLRRKSERMKTKIESSPKNLTAIKEENDDNNYKMISPLLFKKASTDHNEESPSLKFLFPIPKYSSTEEINSKAITPNIEIKEENNEDEDYVFKIIFFPNFFLEQQ